MKTFHGDAFEKVEEAYKRICSNNAKGLDLFLTQKNLKKDDNDFDMKTVVAEHEEDIQVYDTYTQRNAAYPDAVWLYTKQNPLNVETAQFVNDNEPLLELTQNFYKATKNMMPGQYRAFGLTEEDRDKVDAELSSRKKSVLDYLAVINKEKPAEEDKPKVEAYTIDAKENKKGYLETELNPNEPVFVIDDDTWGDYVAHVNECMQKKIRIKEDLKLVQDNKYLITRCYQETGFEGGITIKTIYEIKRDSPLRQYVDVCNTARRFAETEYSSAYKYFVSQGALKSYHPQLSLIDCLYVVSHVETLKKKQAEL